MQAGTADALNAPTRQVERYAAYADRLRQQGLDNVMIVLVAPGSYQGERDRLDAGISLEDAAEMHCSTDERRQEYRRQIIKRAIEKKAATGVRNPDAAMLRLHSGYLQRARERCSESDSPYTFPALQESCYDGHSWIDRIRHPDFPAHVWPRHRLWTSAKDTTGMVDLIISPASETERAGAGNAVPDRAVMTPYSVNDQFPDGKGIRISIRVPEMRQSSGFCEASAARALAAMEQLTDCFLHLK